MGEAYIVRRGGGADLNFRVLNGTSAPANPKENDIWVNTSADVTAWAFSAEEPYSSESTVNCSTGKDATYIAADGAEAYYPASVVTEYIALPAGTAKITVNNSDLVTENMYHAFYTANKTLISTVERKKGSTTYQVPSGAVYVRLTVYNSRDPMNFVATIGMGSGFVWFKTAATSTVTFDALKKNAIEVRPVGAVQWLNGKWTDLTAKIYQNGAWVIFSKFVIFDGSNGISLGTWSKVQSGALTVNANSVRLAADQYNIVAAINDYGVDVTSYKTLTVNVTAFLKAGSQSTHNLVGLSATPTSTDAWGFVASTAVNGVGKYTLDISALTGVHYFKFSNHRYESPSTYLEINYVEFST